MRSLIVLSVILCLAIGATVPFTHWQDGGGKQPSGFVAVIAKSDLALVALYFPTYGNGFQVGVLTKWNHAKLIAHYEISSGRGLYMWGDWMSLTNAEKLALGSLIAQILGVIVSAVFVVAVIYFAGLGLAESNSPMPTVSEEPQK